MALCYRHGPDKFGKDGTVVRMIIKRFLLALMFSITTFANAETVKISTESEALYFQALPYLEKIDEAENELFSIRRQLPANAKFPDQNKEQYLNKVLPLLKEGVPLLKHSADEGNPVARYRLAWVSSHFDPLDQVVDQVCSLLRSSLSQGFAPAGLQMIFYCFDEVETPGFQSLIDALPESEALYSKYYPLPAMMPSCNSGGASDTNGMVMLDDRGFRANLYMSFATQMSRQNLKQEQLRYLNKAAEYGCARAIERLKTKASS
jgi:hypothetical protein